ncbi:alpha/beta hydrolase [Actinomadura sp. ATCC 31491]|uniref:Alpha/beta hydrolase n=1 Tax=Actinomadura luzonensis TaxID=2805427 RepID=A0ABT0FL25_9ACTN|nr:alpha/beta hydrolase [Actinomadura luzonensis]MCK2212991.1 alpha/beta hydrolase [Actinomadura luzonensis]
MRIAVHVGALALAAVVLTPVSASAVSAGAAALEPTPSPTVATPATSDDVYGLSTETIAYGPHRRQQMDVWWTPDGQQRPGVFLIHGGWWSSGDKRYMKEITRSYAELGYTVFNLNYRLSGDAAWPAQRTDALSAIATARKFADRWSFDPGNYVVVGFSAGGHIAAAVGTYGDGVNGLKGVVGLSPIISPLQAYADGDPRKTTDRSKRRLRQAAIKLAGGCAPTGKCSRVWASMEVAWHASKHDVPMLAIHSQDEFVPPAQSILLRDMLAKVGVPVTVLTQPGINHSAPLYREPGVAERVQAWIAERIG